MEQELLSRTTALIASEHDAVVQSTQETVLGAITDSQAEAKAVRRADAQRLSPRSHNHNSDSTYPTSANAATGDMIVTMRDYDYYPDDYQHH